MNGRVCGPATESGRRSAVRNAAAPGRELAEQGMDDARLWQRERDFWLSPAADHAAGLSPHCLMAFAPPTGILRGREAVLDSLRAAPRWTAVEFEQCTLERADPDTAVLAYRALGSRPGAPAYCAYCSSTYRRDGRDWRLIQHQQTPITS